MAISARYSLKKPRPTLRKTITAMMTALVPPPVKPGHERRTKQEEQNRVPNLAKEDRRGTHAMNGERI